MKKCDILEGKQQKPNQKLTIRTTSTKTTTTKSISFMTEIIFIVVKQKTEKIHTHAKWPTISANNLALH